MRKHIIITIILLLVTAFVTVVYFKNLNPPGMRTSRVMHTIPGSATLIFEFNNEKSFYDIFTDNKLFASFIGKQQLGELDTLRQQLLLNPVLASTFGGQNIYISLHPSKTNTFDLMLTTSSASGFEPAKFEELSKQPGGGFVVTPYKNGNRPGYNIYIKAIKKRFYIINKEENIFSGSFSKDLADESAAAKEEKDKHAFVLLSEQQNANSLANLYINHEQLTPLLDILFSNKGTDILKNVRSLPGLAALSLNYRTDALMFNGSTTILQDKPQSYLNLFALQQPVINHLKDIFPSTTAYSVSFAVSDPLKFIADLSQFHEKAGLKKEKDQLFGRVKSETGSSIRIDFSKLLGNEFAVVTTRYFEKLGIVAVTDGSKLKLLLATISKMSNDNSGQFSYDKLPFFLLGDAFSIFKRPYYTIIDNYLVLANSANELTSYSDTYLNRKFLSKNDQYNQFDNLLAARSNVDFLFQFKNAMPILKRDLAPDVYDRLESAETGWKNFYAAGWQFSAADKNFYTNYCMRLNTDTVVNKSIK